MNSINCIVVDDEELARSLLITYIDKLEFLNLVGEAENPLEALGIMKEKQVDLLFLDIEMPGMDGFTFREKINHLYPELNVPFQYISSTREQEIIEKANRLSVEDLIQKPVKAEEISVILRNGINKFAAA